MQKYLYSVCNINSNPHCVKISREAWINLHCSRKFAHDQKKWPVNRNKKTPSLWSCCRPKLFFEYLWNNSNPYMCIPIFHVYVHSIMTLRNRPSHTRLARLILSWYVVFMVLITDYHILNHIIIIHEGYLVSVAHYNDAIMSAMASQINQPHDCLLKRLFRHRLKNTSKLRVNGLFDGN